MPSRSEVRTRALRAVQTTPHEARQRLKHGLQRQMPVTSPLSAYLNWMRQEHAEEAEGLEVDIAEAFTSETGLRVLKLLEKSVLKASQPNGSSDSALREFNAVRNFVLDIERIVSNAR